ncbi:hypothetical protein GCM10028790_55940 [Micromonospora taraxaci]|uniref:Uncharacterized protein n=1 Tax=Micromonospora taraxaci TaxID=1316803 RepID=A0A561W106_9ACTN|nr:hypothetical protein [Micromonospora taraxaci]TWG17565.1 hypothetical protein FHU34_112907 [Micromonospora taraxaci]
MSALTNEVKNAKSPVARWLRATFPHHHDIQADYREAAGPARVLPSPSVALWTQGAAIDWWLRFLIDPAPSIGLAVAGLNTRRAPCERAGLELLHELGAVDSDGNHVGPIHPARFRERSDEWWARMSYALALMVELYRAARVDGSRLMQLGPDSRARDLLALANADEVADLIAMRDLAVKQLIPVLPVGRVATGSTFEGSADLNADADLIVGGVLVDFKSTQGRARPDGSRAAGLTRAEIDQLLGYVLLDYLDAFALHSVAIYTVRYGHYAAWPLEDLCAELAGRPVDLPATRQEFRHLVRELPINRRASIVDRIQRRVAAS